MRKAILGTKIGMTQIFAEDGTVVPVTVVKAGPCYVVQKKTAEADGYTALQIGFGDIKQKNVNKPKAGHFSRAGVTATRFLREVDDTGLEVGSEIKVGVFAAGEYVDVSGVSKGKGFQGVIARHGQHRGPMSHGSRYHRRPGSMGACSTPSRVLKGKRLPGRAGGLKVTVQNLLVAGVDEGRDLLLVKGALPGANGSLLTIKSSLKKA